MKIGDLVRLRKGSAPSEFVTSEGISSTELFLVFEDPERVSQETGTDLFYVLHPGSGKKFPVHQLEVAIIQNFFSPLTSLGQK